MGSGNSRLPLALAAAVLCAVLVAQVAMAGSSTSSGGPKATASATVKKRINSLQRQINQLKAHVGQPGPQGPAGPASGAAGGDLTGTYPNPALAAGAVSGGSGGEILDSSLTIEDIGNNAIGSVVEPDEIVDFSVGASDIANLTRSVNLPLGAFVDLNADAPLNFTSGSDTSPDFVDSGGLLIAYDDDSGLQDSGSVGSTLSVPPDYSSGGTFALRVSKDGETGTVENLFCAVWVNAVFVPSDVVPITGSGIQVITSTPSATYAAGDSVSVHCGAQPFDDTVRFHSVEFRYLATQ